MMNEMIERTLVIGPSWIGDMVMAQALFKAIKTRYPYTQIEVLAPEWSRSLTERMPEVSNSIPMSVKHGELKPLHRYKIAKALRNKKYQRCYVLPNSWKSALIPFWATIPHRIGWRGEWRYGLLNDLRILNKEKLPRMVDRYVSLVFDSTGEKPSSEFTPSLLANPSGVIQACKKYKLDPSHQSVLILCPGAEFGSSKRWPASYYASLADHYCTKGWQIWILGSQKDSEVAQAIRLRMKGNMIDLTGKTSLAEAIDLLSVANKVVSNDSGLMHIAAALGRPVVAIYGSTDPGYTPPLGQQVKIVQSSLSCSPCFERECPLKHHQCMKQLSVEKIMEAANLLPEQECGY